MRSSVQAAKPILSKAVINKLFAKPNPEAFVRISIGTPWCPKRETTQQG